VEKGSLFITAGCIVDLLREKKNEREKERTKKFFSMEIYFEREEQRKTNH
jgi:hypothetical protein